MIRRCRSAAAGIDRQTTVRVSGEVDFATAGILARQLKDVTRREPRRLVIDLAATSFPDTAGLRVIARARQALAPGCPVVPRSPARQVRLALELDGLAAVCVIEEPEPEPD